MNKKIKSQSVANFQVAERTSGPDRAVRENAGLYTVEGTQLITGMGFLPKTIFVPPALAVVVMVGPYCKMHVKVYGITLSNPYSTSFNQLEFNLTLNPTEVTGRIETFAFNYRRIEVIPIDPHGSWWAFVSWGT